MTEVDEDFEARLSRVLTVGAEHLPVGRVVPPFEAARLAAHAEVSGSARRPRRRQGLFAAAAVAAVAGATGGALAVGLSSGGAKAPLQAALVVAQTKVAVSDAAAAGEIGYDHMTMTSPSGTVSWSEDDWFSSSEGRSEVFDASGAVYSVLWHDGTAARSPTMVVNYQEKSYAEGPASSPWRTNGYTQLNQQIADGAYTVSGPTSMDGVSAYQLAETFPNGSTTEIWVNASDYSLARWVNTSSGFTQSWDFSWLPPTPANTAQLAQPAVPAGFTEASVPWLLHLSVTPRAIRTVPGSTTLPSATTLPAVTTTLPTATTLPSVTTTAP